MNSNNYIPLKKVISICNSIEAEANTDVKLFVKPKLFKITKDMAGEDIFLYSLIDSTSYSEDFTGFKEYIEISNQEFLSILQDKHDLDSIFAEKTNQVLVMINMGLSFISVEELELLPFIEAISLYNFWFPSDFRSWAAESLDIFSEDPLDTGDITIAKCDKGICLAKKLGIISEDYSITI